MFGLRDRLAFFCFRFFFCFQETFLGLVYGEMGACLYVERGKRMVLMEVYIVIS